MNDFLRIFILMSAFCAFGAASLALSISFAIKVTNYNSECSGPGFGLFEWLLVLAFFEIMVLFGSLVVKLIWVK